MGDDTNNSSWHLSKTFNVSIVGAIIFQTLVFGFSAGTLNSQVSANALWIQKNESVKERLGTIETNQEWIKDALKQILKTKGK
jgi:hypothetical protein